MPRKRARVPVVFDTNLFVTRFIKHDRHGINRRVMDLWQSQRKLQVNAANLPPAALSSFKASAGGSSLIS